MDLPMGKTERLKVTIRRAGCDEKEVTAATLRLPPDVAIFQIGLDKKPRRL